MTQTQPIQKPPLKLDEDNSIYVPSLGLRLAKQPHLFGLNWHEQKKESHFMGLRFSTLYEELKFLKYLFDNRDNPEYKKIFEHITKAEGSWRAENTDSYFKKVGGQMYVKSHILSQDGQIEEVKAPLEDCLMEDRQIDLEHYLLNHTSQGLPKKDTQKGDFYYLYPRDDSVARFDAGSGWAGLGWGGSPGYSDAWLGVRAIGASAKSAPGKKISRPNLEQVIDSLVELHPQETREAYRKLYGEKLNPFFRK